MNTEQFRYMLYKWTQHNQLYGKDSMMPWTYMHISEDEYNKLVEQCLSKQERLEQRVKECELEVAHTDNALMCAAYMTVFVVGVCMLCYWAVG